MDYHPAMEQIAYSDPKIVARPDYLERRFYYFFSLKLVALLKPTSVTPDQLTILGFALGLLSCVLFLPGLSSTARLLGVLALNLSNVLDAADGQLARARGRFSATGWYVDDLLDRIKIIALFVVLSLHLDRIGAVLALIGLGSLFTLNYIVEYAAAGLIPSIFRRAEAPAPNAILFLLHRLMERIMHFIRRRLRLGFITVGEIYILYSLAFLTGRLRLGTAILAAYCVLALATNALSYLAHVLHYHHRLNAALSRRESIHVFGAGEGGRRIIACFPEPAKQISGILDNNWSLAGTTRFGLPIRHPDEIADWSGLVLIGSVFQPQIQRQLEAKGVRPEDILAI
jgi:phosphatidylglycerophosphate synthase